MLKSNLPNVLDSIKIGVGFEARMICYENKEIKLAQMLNDNRLVIEGTLLT